jgi:predicted metal-dependent phosphoesterase TrpH
MSDSVHFDLQAHSIHSDGVLAPAEVVAAARAAGVERLALSDHDSVDGVAEAVAAGEREGVAIVPAVEISALHRESEDLHILGYGVDIDDPALAAALADFRADRIRRADRMAEALKEVGWELDEQALESRRQSGRSLGRPHLAGAVVSVPANAERLRAEGLENSSRVLEAYLIPGAPAYRGRTHPTVAEAIETIHAAGGVAVWAHPFWDISALPKVEATLREFASQGMDGVEAFYVTYDEAQTRSLVALATELRLLTTGSSDFHGPEHPLFSRFLAHETYGLEPNLGRIGG